MNTVHGMTATARPRLLILGCSTRAAAWSTVRAGFFPVCADEFGDADLQQVAEVIAVGSDFRDRILFAARPKFVTAARLVVSDDPVWNLVSFDPHPDPGRQYFGPYLGSARGAAAVKNRFVLSNILSRANLPQPELRVGPSNGMGSESQIEELIELRRLTRSEVQRTGEANAETPVTQFSRSQLDWLPESLEGWHDPPTDGSWLQKPIRSGGGRGIRVWNDAAASQPLDEPSYFQRFHAGEPYSAIFLAKPGHAELVGISRQLIGTPEAASPWPFGYCGSIGPVRFPVEGVDLLQRIATGLVQWASDLRGLFGIDFIWDGSTPWLVEVNPRYTASCEILELAQRRALLTEHWRACRPDNDPPPEPLPVEPRCGTSPPVLGKLILYARTAVTAPDLSRFVRERSPWTVPFLADVPRVGTPFEPGQPLCTVFASGRDDVECERKLFRRARRVRRWFGDGV